MMKAGEDTSRDALQALATAATRKSWEQAAFRNGMFFILFPAIVPFPPLVTTLHLVPRSLTATVAVVVAWIVLVFCSIAYGSFRIRTYKRDHPFVS
ncbi:MAG: hypothetical protein IAI48_15525 [Candidatus Eremiobacteraeota bacterium]|nr:hypothetical protein [Candidatus Eremiobacteraeota bacterium]